MFEIKSKTIVLLDEKGMKSGRPTSELQCQWALWWSAWEAYDGGPLLLAFVWSGIRSEEIIHKFGDSFTKTEIFQTQISSVFQEEEDYDKWPYQKLDFSKSQFNTKGKKSRLTKVFFFSFENSPKQWNNYSMIKFIK